VSFIKKQEAERGLSVQCKVRVQDDGKYDISVNLYRIFIDGDFPQSVPWDYMVTTRQ